MESIPESSYNEDLLCYEENQGLVISDLGLIPSDKYFLTTVPKDYIEIYLKLIYQNDYKLTIKNQKEFDMTDGKIKIKKSFLLSKRH